jgi:uncharacterized repeat protein (TIGR01451 family)
VDRRDGCWLRIRTHGLAALATLPVVWLVALSMGTATAAAATPTVTCTSDPNVFNTGYDAATGGILPNNAQDANWQVAGPYFVGGTSPATATSLPPGTPSWAPANVGSLAPGAWSPSPFGNAQWISQQTIASPNQGTGTSNADWYYRFQFDLDPSVDPATFSLDMNFLADNDVAEVFVNGVAQSGQTTGLPQNSSNPYFFTGYTSAHAAETTLNHDWQTGLNTIIVQIKSGPPEEGFDAQVRPSAVCPVNLAVSKTATPDPYTPGQQLTYQVTVTNSGPGAVSGVTVSDPLPAALAGAGFTWTCSATAGSSCTASGSGSINDTNVAVDVGGTLTYTVTGTVPASVSGTLTNTATVTPPPGTTDSGCSPSCSSTVNDPNSPEAAVEIKKSASTNPVVPGNDETYTLQAINHGPDAATQVVVSDPLPGGLSFVSASAGCSFAGGTVTCTVPSLASGASQSFQVVARVSSSQTTPITNTATITTSDPPPPGCGCDPYPKSATTTIDVTPQVDLAITKQPSTPTVAPGGQLMYTLIVQNDGPSDATGVTVSDPAPAGLTYVSAQPGQGSCSSGSGVTCSLGSLPAGGTTQILVTAHVAGDASGSLRNTATVAGDQQDLDPANNSSSATVTVKPPPPPAVDVAIAKQASVASVVAGGQVMYTLTVTNNGPDGATGVSVTDTPPSGMTLVSAQPASGTCAIHVYLSCSLGDLAAGGRTQVLVTATVASGAGGALTNVATVTAHEKDTNPANNESRQTIGVQPPAPPSPPQPTSNLRIVKHASRSSVLPGQKLTYTLTVTNAGPAPALGVHVVDTASLPLRVLSVHTTQGSCQKGSPIRCSLGTVAVGGRAKVIVVAKPKAIGKELNAASVTSASRDTNPSGNLAASKVKVMPKLRLRKTATPGTVRPGEDVSYQITVSNATSAPVAKVSVCDRLPSGLVFVSSRPAARLRTGRYCWKVTRLRAHASKRFTLVANAAPSHSGTVFNHAVASAPGARAVTATAAVQVIGVAPVPCATASTVLERTVRKPHDGGPIARIAC